MQILDQCPDLTGRRVLVFDTEATDLEGGAIIEAAWVELEPAAHVGAFFITPNWETCDFPGSEGRHKPDFEKHPMSIGAVATHGILPQDLEHYEPFDRNLDMGDGPVMLIGHSIDFDWKIAGFGDDTPRICTYAMAQRVWPGLSSYKLTALMYHLKGMTEDTRAMVHGAHGAMTDVLLAMTLLFEILRQRPELSTWKQVWEFSEDARLPRRWPIGKYSAKAIGHKQGLTLHETASDYRYIEWVRENIRDNPYLLKALDLLEDGELTP